MRELRYEQFVRLAKPDSKRDESGQNRDSHLLGVTHHGSLIVLGLVVAGRIRSRLPVHLPKAVTRVQRGPD